MPSNRAKCHGREHCCWIGGEACEHLTLNVAGRPTACGLLLNLGSWRAVHNSEAYKPVRTKLRENGIMMDCGDWPQKLLEAGARPGPWACCFREGL